MVVLAGALLAAHLLSGYRLPAQLAFLLLVVAAVMPALTARIAKLWETFSAFIGRVNSRILLTGIYYLVLTPVALLNRLFSGDNLHLEQIPAPGSYWHERNKTYGPEDFKKGW